MSIYSQIAANRNKTWLIMACFVVFLTTIVYAYAKASGYDLSIVAVALGISTMTSIGSYYYADKAILSMSGAREIKKEDNPLLFNTVHNLCIGSGLPLPKIYILQDSAPNAFATGRDPKHAVVCVTTGLLEKLNKAELEGVIAHELSHIKNYDIRLMSIVVVLVGTVTLLADIFLRTRLSGGRSRGNGQAFLFIIGIVLAILSPIVATIIQLAISRKREYLADASGALLTRYPEGLASALEKLARDKEPLEAANKATAHLYIVNPFKNKNIKSTFAGLFDTHPAIEERVKILRSM